MDVPNSHSSFHPALFNFKNEYSTALRMTRLITYRDIERFSQVLVSENNLTGERNEQTEVPYNSLHN